jgi:hypothetical protein
MVDAYVSSKLTACEKLREAARSLTQLPSLCQQLPRARSLPARSDNAQTGTTHQNTPTLSHDNISARTPQPERTSAPVCLLTQTTDTASMMRFYCNCCACRWWPIFIASSSLFYRVTTSSVVIKIREFPPVDFVLTRIVVADVEHLFHHAVSRMPLMDVVILSVRAGSKPLSLRCDQFGYF